MGDYHGIESSVYSIRKKLGRDVIQNVRGYGYQLKKEK
jgi:DNA-binding response OmpR family regulator